MNIDEDTILSYFNGELSEALCQEVECWANESDEHKKLMEQVYYTLSLDRRVVAYDAADTDAAWVSFCAKTGVSQSVQPKKKVRLAWQRYGMVAAAFLAGLIFSAGILLGISDGGNPYEVSTVNGQRARVVLPDGTAVWLNGNTHLRYESAWWKNERTASLQGEAYFEVHHNVFQPFVVHSNGVRTRVLGTKFNVRAREQEQRVVTTLLEGAVQMHCGGKDDREVLLKPGETLTVDIRTGHSKLYTYDEPEEVLLWINGKLQFSDCTLDKIVSSLEKVYNVRFRFAKPDLRKERFTCMFTTDNTLDEILSTLALTNHFCYDKKGRTVYIKPVVQ